MERRNWATRTFELRLSDCYRSLLERTPLTRENLLEVRDVFTIDDARENIHAHLCMRDDWEEHFVRLWHHALYPPDPEDIDTMPDHSVILGAVFEGCYNPEAVRPNEPGTVNWEGVVQLMREVDDQTLLVDCLLHAIAHVRVNTLLFLFFLIFFCSLFVFL